MFFFSFFILLASAFYFSYYERIVSNNEVNKPIEASSATNEIIDGIHVRTGLKDGKGLMTVIANCTACHSAQLIIQNKMNKEKWNATIRWMQETQNLWPLGDNQEVIVNYLVNNYPVIDTGRRKKLDNIQWYNLKE